MPTYLFIDAVSQGSLDFLVEQLNQPPGGDVWGHTRDFQVCLGTLTTSPGS